MQILLYNDLNTRQIPGFAKMLKYLEADDFKSAEVKKVGDNLYRARLNQSDRLLFSVYRHQGQAYALILEYIKNHAYQDSRFLRRATAARYARYARSQRGAHDFKTGPKIRAWTPGGRKHTNWSCKAIRSRPTNSDAYAKKKLAAIYELLDIFSTPNLAVRVEV